MKKNEEEQEVHYRETKYGFEYGALTIERLFSVEGYVYVSAKTKRDEVQICCSPRGRSLRIFRKGKRIT